MKACGVSGAARDVVLLELPDPPSPGPGQILVAVEAAGVGPWDGLLDGGWDVGLRPPAALGVEGAGRVLEVGADVDEFAVGDRVLAHEGSTKLAGVGRSVAVHSGPCKEGARSSG
jgi:NADPH:quinone reductase-like Zn-dependent oxidoreductase